MREEQEKQRRREKAMLDSPGCDAFRPSALFTYTPQKWNPARQIHFARVGGFPLVRRVNPGAFRSSSGTWAPLPDRRASYSPLVAQPSSPAPSAWLPPAPASPAWAPPAPAPLSPDPCARETVVKALSTLMACRKRPKAKEEGSPSSPTTQESKRRRQDSAGSGRPAFEPVVANGAPAAQVPKPGALKRGAQLSPTVEDSTCKKSCPCPVNSAGSLSPRPVRNNCIYSSYSSSGGIEQLWKRRGVRTSSVSSQDSSCSESPAQPLGKGPPSDCSLLEKAATPKSRSSAPAKADKAVQVDMVPEDPLQNQGSPLASLPAPSAPSSGGSSGGGGPRRRKVQLVLIPKEPLVMPPPVELGYKITVADYNADRLERLKQFRRGLDSGKDTPPPAEEEASSAPSDGSPPGQESQKNTPEGEGSSGQAGSPPTPTPTPAPAAAAAAVSAPLEASPMPLGLPTPSSLPGTPAPVPAGSRPGEAVAQPVPPAPLAAPMGVPPLSLGLAQLARGGNGSGTPSSSSEDLVQTPAKPSATAPTKPSLLFGMLTSPLGGQPTTAATATTASPAPSTSFGASTTTFPLVFGTPASNGRSGLLAGGAPGAPALAPGGTLSSPAPASATPNYSFKPIFGAPAPPASTASPAAVSSPSLLAFSTGLQPAAAPGRRSSGLQGFSAPSAGLATPSAAHSGAASVTTVSASRAMFSLGPSVLATTTAVAAASSSLGGPSAPQASRFGVPSSSGSASASPLYPFGTLASSPGPVLGPLASSTFGQPLPGTSEGAHGPAAPMGFGSGCSQVAPAAPLAVTTQSLFGSSSPASAAAGLVSAAKPLLPSGANEGVPEGQPPTLRVAPGLVSFGSPSSFTGSEAPPAFGGGGSSTTTTTAQAPFGGSGALTSFGAKSTPQPPFGPLTSFATAPTPTTTLAFGSGPQPPGSSSGGSSTGGFTFRGAAPPSFPFGVSTQPPPPPGGTAFGGGAGRSSGSPTSGMLAVNFQFVSGATGAATPFGASVGQNSLGGVAQSSDGFSLPPSVPETKTPFGAALPGPPAFGQGTSAAGGPALGGSTPTFGTAGTSAFRSASTPTFTGSGATFGPTSAPSFSIGSGTRTGGRQRLQARRQHVRKK